MKSGFVNLIGRPNVGKSSILNRLIGAKLSIVTDRPQTTRKSMKFIYTDDRCQIIFFDNPGFQTPKNKLGHAMQDIILKNIKDSDVNIYVMDNSIEIGRLDMDVLELAKKDKTEKIVVVNKKDLLSKDEISILKEKYDRMNLFSKVIFISSLTGEGYDELLDTLYEILPEGPYYYDKDMITDTITRDILEEILREKCLIFLKEEIPHGIYIDTDEYLEDEEKVSLRLNLYIERESHKSIIIGKNGVMINKIIKAAKKEMEFFMGKKVSLKVNIKLRKNWRKNLPEVMRMLR